jgi:hypothetical protein
MLSITVPAAQFWDEENKKFIYSEETELELEHSLVSISKWEARYHKSFFSKEQRTDSETRYYVKCMTLNKVSDEKIYWALSEKNVEEIGEYIRNPMTATKLKAKKDNKKGKKKRNRELTTEYIYYLMIQYGIPHEFENWHIERLLTLIQLCDEENAENDPETKKKEPFKSERERVDDMIALNERRIAALHTRG